MRILPLLLAIAAILTLPNHARPVSVLLPTEEAYPPLSIKSHLVDVRIDGPIARTRIAQVFHNPHPTDLEATFVISLPPNAQVTDFVMIINGQEVHAQALESHEAREIYTRIVRQMKDPGLLEFIDRQTFRVRVYPVPRQGDMPIELSFAQPLRRQGELLAYDFPATMAAGSRQIDESTFSATIHWDAPLGTIYSPTHKVDIQRSEDGRKASLTATNFQPEDHQDLALLFAPETQDVGIHLVTHRPDSNQPGSFLLMIHPPESGALAQPIPKTVTFVLDISGSMNEEGKIDKAKSALTQCLGALGPDDKFNILTFETGTARFQSAPVPATSENLAAARQFIERIRARGGTNFHKALLEALAHDQGEQLHQIVVLTDGLPTVGVTSPEQILRAVKSSNASDLRVFTLGLGFDVNTHLLDAVAGETRALSAYVKPNEDLEVKVSSFFDSVAYPVLTRLELEIAGLDAFDIYPQELPDLFKGQDLTVFGRYPDGGEATIRLTGLAGDEEYATSREVPFAAETDMETAYIAALWANRKVGYLLDQIRHHGESPELREAVIELAEEYNLVTPYTSFLVADDSESVGDPVLGIPLSAHGNIAPYETTTRQPRGKMIQGGVSAAPQAEADSSIPHYMHGRSSSTSGEAAVAYSESLSERKRTQTLVSTQPSDRDVSVRRAAGQTFERTGEHWIQKDMPKDAVELKVKYLSDAYFELLSRFPAQKPAMLLGDQVTLVLAGYRVVIGAEGFEKAEALPAALKP